jgi:hypothetical protein
MKRFVIRQTLIAVALGAIWIALPAVILADDCSDASPGEVGSCGAFTPLLLGALIAGSLIAGTSLFRRPGPGARPPKYLRKHPMGMTHGEMDMDEWRPNQGPDFKPEKEHPFRKPPPNAEF